MSKACHLPQPVSLESSTDLETVLAAWQNATVRLEQTHEALRAEVQRLTDELDIPFDRQQNEALRGVSRRRSLELLLDGQPTTEEQSQEWMTRKNEYYVALPSARSLHQTFSFIAPGNLVVPSETIVVEDAASGVEAAVAGGFWTN